MRPAARELETVPQAAGARPQQAGAGEGGGGQGVTVEAQHHAGREMRCGKKLTEQSRLLNDPSLSRS